MKLLLLTCNKVSEESFRVLSDYCTTLGIDTQIVSLSCFGNKTDILPYERVGHFLEDFPDISAILVADIFWPTGQNICRWCDSNGVKCFFWQHGQWIYTTNKKNPRFLPFMTFVLGENTRKQCMSWPYGRRSQVLVSGSPRYDNCSRNADGEYVYCSFPVLVERSPSVPDRHNSRMLSAIKSLSGLNNIKTVIHPHYREEGVDTLKQLFPKCQFADRNESALSLISKSKKVLTHRNSTSVLDAIACGKQSVLMDFLGDDYSHFPPGYFGNFATESNNADHCLRNLLRPTVQITDYVDKAKPFISLENASKTIVDCMYNVVR